MSIAVFYSSAYSIEQGFATVGKSAWLAQSLAERPIVEVELHDPESIDLELLGRVHSGDYIDDDLIRRREASVFEWARANELPIAWVLAGGYPSHDFTVRDVAKLHRITVEEAARAFAVSRSR
ncbi:MAG: hypothetical protein ACKODY_07580 [Actinomycetota bacterium]